GGIAEVVTGQDQPRAAYDYDAYGNARTDGTAVGTPSTVDNPIRFAALYLDDTLGSRYSTPARTYDPATGRFASTDPLSPGQMVPPPSGYASPDDRPTNLVDPSGLRPICGDDNPHLCAVGEEGWWPPPPPLTVTSPGRDDPFTPSGNKPFKPKRKHPVSAPP